MYRILSIIILITSLSFSQPPKSPDLEKSITADLYSQTNLSLFHLGIFHQTMGTIGLFSCLGTVTAVIVSGAKNGWESEHTISLVSIGPSIIAASWEISIGRRLRITAKPNIFFKQDDTYIQEK